MERLHRRVSTQYLQSQQYCNQMEENQLRAEACAKRGNAIGVAHYVREARKAEYYYGMELKHMANTSDMVRKLREAMVNAETIKNMSAANTTLEQLKQAMPLHQLDDIMDAFQDNSLIVKQQSDALAQPFELEEEDVDAEVQELMAKAVKLPDVPSLQRDAVPPARSAGGTKAALKDE